MLIQPDEGQVMDRDFLERLVELHIRNDIEFSRGTFRVRGDVVELFLPGCRMPTVLNFSG
jgi:excinuclease ABC subunit B